MRKYPLFIDLHGRRVPVIGGGVAALRKARLIAAAGARPAFIWPEIDPEIEREFGAAAEYLDCRPAAADLAGARIVFVAVEDEDAPERWAAMARDGGALVNVVDRPDLCDFTTPSIVDRGALTIAISTDGAGPVYGRDLRAKIEAMLPARIGALLDFAAGYRDAVKAKIGEPGRRAFWERFFRGPVAARALTGDDAGAHEAMIETLNRPEGAPAHGAVHIVGAGPGDPDLLTLKAFRLIQEADVILYDRLVSDEILNLARRDADRIYVGKAKANHAVPQEEIEARMIALAREGKMVVRLKGGDPFVFGRGGEELDALRAAGISAIVTPGVTAAAGCAASAGMPLTHRDYAQAVTFVTGHAKGDADPDLDWAALATLKNTLVVYMGVGKAANISSNLIRHGRSLSTPVAVVENGTRPEQIIVKGQLGELPTLIERAGIKGPALLVIGEVAALADGETLNELLAKERLVA